MKRFAILSLLVFFSCFLCGQKAVVIVPVADLIGAPLHDHPFCSYKTLPLSGAKPTPYQACPRMYQLLFNEVVEIKSEVNDEVKVTVPNIFYTTNESNKKYNTFWTKKSNLLPLSQLKPQVSSAIPEPLSFTENDKTQEFKKKNIATLIKPITDKKTGLTFSVGTRFVITKDNLSDKYITVSYLDPIKQNTRSFSIKRSCINISGIKTKKQRIADFVTIARSWIPQNNLCVPYVWGGASFTSGCTDEPFKKITAKKDNTPYAQYHRKKNNTVIKNGFDCASLVCRAAQAAGIPFYLRNTKTIQNNLKPITSYKELKNGDIIWIPWHVMIVTDKQNNTVLEASSYLHGTGKVQEVSLAELFEGINNYKELVSACQQKKRIYRRNTLTKKKDHPIDDLQLLSIESVWTTH